MTSDCNSMYKPASDRPYLKYIAMYNFACKCAYSDNFSTKLTADCNMTLQSASGLTASTRFLTWAHHSKIAYKIDPTIYVSPTTEAQGLDSIFSILNILPKQFLNIPIF